VRRASRAEKRFLIGSVRRLAVDAVQKLQRGLAMSERLMEETQLECGFPVSIGGRCRLEQTNRVVVVPANDLQLREDRCRIRIARGFGLRQSFCFRQTAVCDGATRSARKRCGIAGRCHLSLRVGRAAGTHIEEDDGQWPHREPQDPAQACARHKTH
jgi:hypothetical protein